MPPTDPVLEKLDELIAATRSASIPVSQRWLDAAGVAALLSVGLRQMRERLAARPDFPRPLKIGHPRWKAGEVLAWAEQQRKHHTPDRPARRGSPHPAASS